MSRKDYAQALRVGNAVAFAGMIVVNSLAGGTGLIGGRNTAQVSAAFPTLITPAGFTFSIWGVIYALLAAFIVFQFLPSHREAEFNGRVSYFFMLSCLFNVAWLFLWQYEYITASVPVIFALLATLIVIYLRLDIGRSQATRAEKICVDLPFSVYLGWITIASIADVASGLVSVDWSGLGLSPSTWAQVVVVVALAIALTGLATRRDPAFGLVIMWALAGITANQLAHPEVALVTGASAIVVAIATSAVFYSVLPRRAPKSVGR
jgi:hypothetical protein